MLQDTKLKWRTESANYKLMANVLAFVDTIHGYMNIGLTNIHLYASLSNCKHKGS